MPLWHSHPVPKKPDKALVKLNAMGGKVTTLQNFLALSNEDMAVIEARLALASAIREQREKRPYSERVGKDPRFEPSPHRQDGGR